jgi:type I restriction enzyme S subunit
MSAEREQTSLRGSLRRETEVGNEWKVSRIIDVAKIVGGGTPRRGRPEYWNGDTLWLTPSELENDRINYVFDTEEKITRLGQENSNAQLVPPNSVILTCTATIGKLAINRVPLATNQQLNSFVVDSSKVYPEFLAYYLLFSKEKIKRLGGETTFRFIRKDIIGDFEVPLPSLDEQKRIAFRIEQLTSKIDQVKRLKEEVLKDAEAIMQAALNQLFLNIEHKNLRMEKLGRLVEMRGGGTPSKDKVQYWTGTIPWVSPKDMKAYEILDSQDHITKEAIEESATNLIEQGNVLVVFRSGILAHTIPVAVNRVPVTVNQDLKALNSIDKDLTNEFLAWFLRSAKEKLLQCVKFGATVHSIEVSKFQEIHVPIPKLDEQNRLVKYFESVTTKTRILQSLQMETKNKIDQMTKAVLRVAFNGKL